MVRLKLSLINNGLVPLSARPLFAVRASNPALHSPVTGRLSGPLVSDVRSALPFIVYCTGDRKTVGPQVIAFSVRKAKSDKQQSLISLQLNICAQCRCILGIRLDSRAAGHFHFLDERCCGRSSLSSSCISPLQLDAATPYGEDLSLEPAGKEIDQVQLIGESSKDHRFLRRGSFPVNHYKTGAVVL